ncbi:hypothetical protein [Taylorella equigenitalis]|uniref:hypothetical protein n=1 Tax=Taylorella equigenitalis TaxID=29575 RepID=UPI00237D637E|nr:hypothetical protein [Taylorella equigenitalis]WDU51408.1 hypothetical protein KNO32_05400 [Taylorella equigenitalis]
MSNDFNEIKDVEISETTSRHDSIFTNGTFVLGLIIFGILGLVISWSVSFTTMFFGMVGTIVSVGTCSLSNSELEFSKSKLPRLRDENYVYIAIRSVIGALSGTALVLMTIQHVQIHWSHLAVVSLFSAFAVDQIVFKRVFSK